MGFKFERTKALERNHQLPIYFFKEFPASPDRSWFFQPWISKLFYLEVLNRSITHVILTGKCARISEVNIWQLTITGNCPFFIFASPKMQISQAGLSWILTFICVLHCGHWNKNQSVVNKDLPPSLIQAIRSSTGQTMREILLWHGYRCQIAGIDKRQSKKCLAVAW